jgi:hypothetical protein
MKTREGSLRPEAAGFYPLITPGVWVRAMLLQRQVQRYEAARGAAGVAARRAGLRDDHFAFRDQPSIATSVIPAAPVARRVPRGRDSKSA